MFERIVKMIGEEGLAKIKSKTVLVVGLGGVGGFAVEALARSGISHFVLIDSDIVEESNLNRQILTTRDSIGTSKVSLASDRIKSINSECEVITQKIWLDSATIGVIDKYKIDYIVDACDSVEAKKLLIDYSIEKDIKLISCMGTAKKMDPSRLEIVDIRKTSYDPLARILRKYVVSKKINKKIYVVSSTEKVIESESLPSMIFVPSVAGILCANYVVNDILKEKD